MTENLNSKPSAYSSANYNVVMDWLNAFYSEEPETFLEACKGMSFWHFARVWQQLEKKVFYRMVDGEARSYSLTIKKQQMKALLVLWESIYEV